MYNFQQVDYPVISDISLPLPALATDFVFLHWHIQISLDSAIDTTRISLLQSTENGWNLIKSELLWLRIRTVSIRVRSPDPPAHYIEVIGENMEQNDEPMFLIHHQYYWFIRISFNVLYIIITVIFYRTKEISWYYKKFEDIGSAFDHKITVQQDDSFVDSIVLSISLPFFFW